MRTSGTSEKNVCVTLYAIYMMYHTMNVKTLTREKAELMINEKTIFLLNEDGFFIHWTSICEIRDQLGKCIAAQAQVAVARGACMCARACVRVSYHFVQKQLCHLSIYWSLCVAVYITVNLLA